MSTLAGAMLTRPALQYQGLWSLTYSVEQRQDGRSAATDATAVVQGVAHAALRPYSVEQVY